MEKNNYSYADYLCDTINDLDREVRYESMGITAMPWMKDEFVAWCVAKGLSERTAKSYASHLKALDKDVFDSFAYLDEEGSENTRVEDFYPYLKALFEMKKKEEIDSLFDEAGALIGRFRAVAKDYDRGEDNVRDMASAFAKYREFINEKLDEAEPEQPKAVEPESAYPFIDKFAKWLTEAGGVSEDTTKSYLSYLASLNEQVLCKMTKSGKSPLLLLHGASLKRGHAILEQIEGIYTGRRLGGKIRNINERTLGNWASAFRKYLAFYGEMAVGAEDIQLDMAKDEAEEEIDCGIELTESDLLMYEAVVLQKNFLNRNYSQNRMSKNLKTFYLPGILNTLFSKAKKKGEANWFTVWGMECFEKVEVLVSENGKTVKLSDVKLIAISPVSGKVYATLVNGVNVAVYTRTADRGIREMVAKTMAEVSIEHVEPMKNILENDGAKFKSFEAITKIVRGIHNRSRIPLSTAKEHKAITRFRRAIFKNEKYQTEKEELFNLIPQIKDDLRLLSQRWKLELMEKGENMDKSDTWDE